MVGEDSARRSIRRMGVVVQAAARVYCDPGPREGRCAAGLLLAVAAAAVARLSGVTGFELAVQFVRSGVWVWPALGGLAVVSVEEEKPGEEEQAVASGVK